MARWTVPGKIAQRKKALHFFVVAFLILCIAADGWLIQMVRYKMSQSAIMSIQNLFVKSSENMDIVIENDIRTVRDCALKLNTSDMDKTAVQMAQLAKVYGFSGAAYARLDGNGCTDQGEPFSIEDLQCEEFALSEGKTGFSNAYIGGLGVWESTVQIPVERNRKPVGALYVHIPMTHYNQNGILNFYEGRGFAYVASFASKRIILTPDTPNVMWVFQDTQELFAELGFGGADKQAEIYSLLEQGDRQTIRGTLRGEQYYLSLVPLTSNRDWFMCSVVPVREVQRESDYILALLSAIIGTILLMAALLGVMAALSNRRRTQEMQRRYQESEYQNATYDALAGANNAVVCFFSRNEKCLDQVFRNSERIMGHSSESYLGNPVLLRELCGKADAALYGRILADDIHEEEVYDLQLRHPVTDEIQHIRFTIKEIVVASEQKYLFLWEDMTQEIKTQQALRAAMLDAEQASRSKSAFLSSMSHEIRTPMNALIGMNEIAKQHLGDADRLRDCFHKIEISAKHLLGIINDILDLSKIESGRLQIAKESFRLSEVVSNAVTIIRVQAKSKRHDFTASVRKIEHDDLIGDPTRLGQVLINLLNNAVKYTKEGGSLSLSIEELMAPADGLARFWFCVQDNGVGMSPAFIQKIGRPFEQENNALHTTEGGTGLGLSIVSNIIRLQGGQMQIDSALGRGTAMMVVLDFALDKQEPVPDIGRLRQSRILIAGADADEYEETARVLRSVGAEGFRATDGESICTMLGEGSAYDVLLLSGQMLDRSGAALVERIRAQCDNPPAIVLFGYDWTEVQAEAEKAGVCFFVEKPLFRSRLLQALVSAVSKPCEQAAATQARETLQSLQGSRILLVEDNALNREIAIELLEIYGVTVDTACNGKEAYEQFLRQPRGTYSVILMDIQMPVWDGLTAAKAIRASARADGRSIPILALTANAFAEDIQQCKEAGMDDYIAKPLDVDRMYQMLAQYIARGDEGI